MGFNGFSVSDICYCDLQNMVCIATSMHTPIIHNKRIGLGPPSGLDCLVAGYYISIVV